MTQNIRTDRANQTDTESRQRLRRRNSHRASDISRTMKNRWKRIVGEADEPIPVENSHGLHFHLYFQQNVDGY